MCRFNCPEQDYLLNTPNRPLCTCTNTSCTRWDDRRLWLHSILISKDMLYSENVLTVSRIWNCNKCSIRIVTVIFMFKIRIMVTYIFQIVKFRQAPPKYQSVEYFSFSSCITNQEYHFWCWNVYFIQRKTTGVTTTVVCVVCLLFWGFGEAIISFSQYMFFSRLLTPNTHVVQKWSVRCVQMF